MVLARSNFRYLSDVLPRRLSSIIEVESLSMLNALPLHALRPGLAPCSVRSVSSSRPRFKVGLQSILMITEVFSPLNLRAYEVRTSRASPDEISAHYSDFLLPIELEGGA